MTISAINFLAKVSDHLNDNLTGTTDADGAADKLNFKDSALSKYDDKHFGDPERSPEWWAYIGTELRTIYNFQSTGGVVSVHKAFGSQVVASTAYELHKFDRAKKLTACNKALNACYPRFYKRVEDVSLTGKGAGDTKYEVPATFTEFPDQILEKHESGTVISYVEVTNYDAQEVGGTMFFYADITTDKEILLIGKTYLSQFTNDASETELDNAQADMVSYLAAAIFCRMMSAIVNATDAGRFDSLAQRYEAQYNEGKEQPIGKPASFPRTLDWSWLEE